jgi:hypothetical protein
MSTRALYTFTDATINCTAHNVYKHHDGYPSGAAKTLTAAMAYAWQEPRFEANEFAASFVAAAKMEIYKNVELFGPGSAGGGVRLMPSGAPQRVADKNCADIEYRYAVYLDGKLSKIMVKAFVVSAWGKYHEKLLFTCPLTEMVRTVAAIDRAKEGEAIEAAS